MRPPDSPPAAPRGALPALAALAALALAAALAADAHAGVGGFLSGQGSRARVLQVCIVTMAVALFIMLKKFAPPSSRPGAAAPNPDYAGTGQARPRSPRP